MLAKFASIFSRIISILAQSGGILFILIWLAICYDVIVRFLTNHTLPAITEISESMLVYITFLGSAWLLEKEGHVSMDVVITKLNARNQALANIIGSIICAVVCAVVAWHSVVAALNDFKIDYRSYKVLGFPTGPFMSIIALGFFLLFVQFVRRTYGYLGRLENASSTKKVDTKVTD